MIIRQANPGDALAIATIHVRSWQHAYREILPVDRLAALSIPDREQQWLGDLDPQVPAVTIVAEVNNAVAGFASWNTIPNSEPVTAMLSSLYMAPAAMGHGIGSALLDQAERDMIAVGATLGTLHVLADNAPTRAFYERQGWSNVRGSEQTEHFFGIDVRTVAYRKRFL